MPYIKESCAQNIKERADIVDVISEFVELKKRGSTYFGLSPFANEKTPSFCVTPAKNSFKDYSSGKYGDSVTFLMEKRNMGYVEALEWLAGRYQIPLEYDDSEKAKERAKQEEKRKDLRPIVSAAATHYRAAFVQLPADHPAKLEVFGKRKYTEEQAEEWGIGYAPGSTFLFDKLKENNLLTYGRELGLIGEKNVDMFWNRVMYPIKDKNGLMVGFGGRDLSVEGKFGKWINSKESELYQKNKIWYGLDKVGNNIAKCNEAWIVEGYNDVISMYFNGKPNAVAPCGTSITDRHVQELRRYTDRVVFAMDGDKAGKKAGMKGIEQFIKAGFWVEVYEFPDNMDADDYCRKEGTSFEDIKKDQKNGFFHLLEHHVSGDERDRSMGIHKMTELLASVKDPAMESIYMGALVKASKLKESAVKNLLKQKQDEQAEKGSITTDYLMPKGMDALLESKLPDIEKYALFMAKNQIWMMRGEEKPFTFQSVANFEIEFLQHMRDEKFPAKLVRITNTKNESHVFDVPSNELNTPQQFDNVMSQYGNFLWNGSRPDFQRLRKYLYDHMGVGTKVEVLGWQPDGFWIFNNGAFIPGRGRVNISEFGVLNIEKHCYYIPSANKIYQNNPYKFSPQKLVVLEQAKYTFSDFATQFLKVHRGHAYTALLHTISSIFLDIVNEHEGFFPLLFLYGPPSTGKDEMIEVCQSFFGKPQTRIHLGNNTSTQKAQIRKFAQFTNMIVHLSEYNSGNRQMNEMLKGLWDRAGYERGNIESNVGTDTVPILSSVMFTGNSYVDDDALITRCIAEEVVKTDFTAEDVVEFEKLKEMVQNGISSYTADILHFRDQFKAEYPTAFMKAKKELKEALGLIVHEERMFSNAAVYGAALLILKDRINIPFTFEDFTEHMRQVYTRQVRKLNIGSMIEKFWNIFLSAVRMQNDPLVHGREFRIKGNELQINITHVFNRVSQLWFSHHQEKAPGVSDVMDAIKRDESVFVEQKGSIRYGEKKSSGWVLNLDSLSIKEDLLETIEWKEAHNKKEPDFDPTSGKTPFDD